VSTRTSRAQATGPRALKGSAEARRSAAAILEALTGVRSTQEAADALGVALPRYYVLETRALEGFIGALEPRARGRKRTNESETRALKSELAAAQRELRRYQALHRTAQRALGLAKPAAAKPKAASKKKSGRGPSRKPRGERILRVLKERDEGERVTPPLEAGA
jgi:hypothetical protein